MKRRGLTLIETLVVCVILSVILAVLGEMLMWGLRAHKKGEAVRKATALGREIIGHLTSQIASGVTLDTFSADITQGVTKDFQSAVLWPDCYLDYTNVFLEPFYARERINTTLPGGELVPTDRVNNRLIFSRPGKQAGKTYNDRDYSQFVFVEYVVLPSDPTTGAGQHRLYRRLFQVAEPPALDPRGVNLGGYKRIVDPVFFALNPLDPLDNPKLLVKGLPAKEKAEQCIIIELPNERDQISFSVEHTQFVSKTGQQPPKVAAFDPSLFTVSVTLKLDKQGDFLATQTLSEQARVKAGD